MYEFLKKKYGQNFLIDNNILEKITQLIPNSNLNIVEIGPGDGRLTDYILKKKPSNLLLVEIDKDLIPLLESKYSKSHKIKILNENILDYEFNEKYDLIISNLPYNISSQILVKICLLKDIPEKLIFMFQKEFADRLTENKLNSLNSLVGCFFEIKTNFKVSKYCFRPIPKVDSKVILFSKKTKPLLDKIYINKFILFKRRLFSQKRKTLSNILKAFKDDLDEFNLSRRPEELELKELILLFEKINL